MRDAKFATKACAVGKKIREVFFPKKVFAAFCLQIFSCF